MKLQCASNNILKNKSNCLIIFCIDWRIQILFLHFCIDTLNTLIQLPNQAKFSENTCYLRISWKSCFLYIHKLQLAIAICDFLSSNKVKHHGFFRGVCCNNNIRLPWVFNVSLNAAARRRAMSPVKARCCVAWLWQVRFCHMIIINITCICAHLLMRTIKSRLIQITPLLLFRLFCLRVLSSFPLQMQNRVSFCGNSP